MNAKNVSQVALGHGELNAVMNGGIYFSSMGVTNGVHHAHKPFSSRFMSVCGVLVESASPPSPHPTMFLQVRP